MKGDLTRSTFEPKKHYDRVLEQQGRVTLDADFNEQADLATYRLQSTAADIIGPSGAPMLNAGFEITDPAALTAAQKNILHNLGLDPAAKGDLMIGAGHYYVDGILAENDQLAPYSKQPHLPGASTNQADGDYIVYLDVWKRHISPLEDPDIREVALGGPDTATRSQVIWQVKLHKLAGGEAGANCDTQVNSFDQAIAPSTGTLAARSQPSAAGNVCVLPPTAGYRRLENQLYRVEIHDVSNPAKVSFKWSRENGSIISAGQFINNLNDRMRLTQPGRDALRGFAAGDWVELSTDARELNFTPGILVRLKKVDGSDVTLDLATATAPVNVADFPSGAKVRRWDSPGLILLSSADPAVDDGYLRLEDGVQVKFTAGTYHNGDYWEIPARTALGDILWPRVDQGLGPVPLSLPPRGIRHHFARLAMVHFAANVVTSIKDCRHLFPPLTKLTGFFYVCGDGQMATPNVSAPLARLPLLHKLQAGVANGSFPVAGAPVKFSVTVGNGQVNGALSVVVTTDNLGVAECTWAVDSTTAIQEVEARLIDGNSQPVHLPVRYAASLDTADRVSYNPQACSTLAGAFTVQAALDRLCKLGHGCCVTVGKEGEYPTIEAALKDLLEKRVICICLLAGEHVIEKPIDFIAKAPGTVVHIHGCGGATRVRSAAGAFVSFRGDKDATLDEVHLAEFELLFKEGFLRFQSVSSVTIDNFVLSSDTPVVVLQFSDVQVLRMWHSTINGLSNKQQPLVDVNGVHEVWFEYNRIDAALPRNGDFSAVFDTRTRQFAQEFSALRTPEVIPFADAWAKSIPADARERAAYAKLVAAATIAGRDLTQPEKDLYVAAGDLITDANPDALALVPFVNGLRVTAQVQGAITVLAFNNISTRLELTGNVVGGITVFYGRNPALVGQQEFEAVVKKKPKLPATWPVRDAILQANDFAMVTVDKAYWNAVVQTNTVPPVTFRNLGVADNRLHGAPNTFVAGFLRFSANFFNMVPGFNGGAMGVSAAFATNQGQVLNDAVFFDSGAVNNQTGAYLNSANQMFIRPIA
jgi:Family of unknown function (DUF6519)